MDKTSKVKEVITEEGEEEFHWRYAILETKHGGQTHFQVCEEYPGLGYTGAETPLGESPEDLQTVLEMMLADVKGAIACNNILVEGEPYDDWRAKELDEGDTLSVEETKKWLDDLARDEDDIGNDPTVPFIKEFEK